MKHKIILLSLLSVLGFSSCRTSLVVGKVSGNSEYKNTIQSINILDLIPLYYPQLGKFKSPWMNGGRLNSPYSQVSYLGTNSFLYKNGDALFTTYWNGRMVFLKFSNSNYMKPSKILVLSNLKNDTFQFLNFYKTNESLRSNDELQIIEDNGGLICQLQNCLLSLDDTLGIKAIKGLKTLESEVALQKGTQIRFFEIQKISTGPNFILRNEVQKSHGNGIQSIELLIELDCQLKLIRQEKLPVIDFGKLYYNNSYKDKSEEHMHELYLDIHFPNRATDSLTLEGEFYKSLTFLKQVEIDNIFKIGETYYYISDGFIGNTDSAFKTGDNYFVDYSSKTNNREVHKHYTRVVNEEEIKKYLQDSIFEFEVNGTRLKYVNDYIMSLRQATKLVVVPLKFSDTIRYNYLNSSVLSSEHLTNISRNKTKYTHSYFNINNLNGNLVAGFDDAYYSTYILPKERNEFVEKILMNSEIKEPVSRTLFFDTSLNVLKVFNSHLAQSKYLTSYSSGYASLFEKCGYSLFKSGCNSKLSNRELYFLIYDTLNKRDTFIAMMSDYYTYNGLFNKQIAIVPYLKGLKSIVLSSNGHNMEVFEITLNSELNVNSNDYQMRLSSQKNNELSIEIKSNGLFQLVPIKFWLNFTKPDSGVYVLNNKYKVASKFNSGAYNELLVYKSSKQRERHTSIWEDNLKFVVDSVYTFQLRPGVYYFATEPIYPTNINKDKLYPEDVATTDFYDGFGRRLYGNRDGSYDDRIFIRYQFKVIVYRNGSIRIKELKY